MKEKEIKDILNRLYKELYTMEARFKEDPTNKEVIEEYRALDRKILMLMLTSYKIYDLKTYRDIMCVINEVPGPNSALMIHEYITDEKVLKNLRFDNWMGPLN